MDGFAMAMIKGIVFLLVGLMIYFFPSYIAGKREHHASNAITLVNLIAGWTLIGWVACLISAYSNEAVRIQKVQKNIKNNDKPSQSSVADEIKKLAELKDSGILTQDEFDIKKKQLLEK